MREFARAGPLNALVEVACRNTRFAPRLLGAAPARFARRAVAGAVGRRRRRDVASRPRPPPTALSLAETLRLAVARSPQLGSQRAMVDAAREMAGPAGELPDPKLKVGVENVPTEGPDAWSLTRDFMTMSRIGLMQEFPRAEKRELKSQRVAARRRARRGGDRGDDARGPARGGDRVARAPLRRRRRAR